jgi:hypothetical protein
MGFSEKDMEEIKAWKKPVVGDKMQTPSGVVIVTEVTEHRWSADRLYGNIPFWESYNWRIFKVIT